MLPNLTIPATSFQGTNSASILERDFATDYCPYAPATIFDRRLFNDEAIYTGSNEIIDNSIDKDQFLDTTNNMHLDHRR